MTTTTPTYRVTVRGIDGEDPKMDAAGVALLYGVTVEEVKAVAPGPLPAEWVQRSIRRAKEAQAHTGTDDDLWAILEYWAAKELGAELEVVAQ